MAPGTERARIAIVFRRSRLVRDAFSRDERLRLDFDTPIGVAEVYVEKLPYGGQALRVPSQPDRPELEGRLREATQRVLDATDSAGVVGRWVA